MSVFVKVTKQQAAVCRYLGLKEVYVCPDPDCGGPLVAADEDGCCVTCGAPCEILEWREVPEVS